MSWGTTPPCRSTAACGGWCRKVCIIGGIVFYVVCMSLLCMLKI